MLKILKQAKVAYRFLSRKFLTQKRTKKIISGFLLVVGIFSGFLMPAASAYANSHTLNNLSTAQFTPIETATLTGLQAPLENYSISQYFSVFHPGLDLDALYKEPIFPIDEGKVEEVKNWSIGYGKYIIINHGRGLESLYAHLSSIEVEKGEKVGKNTIIGLVGSTGWSTGSHLHLEIWQSGKALNPVEILTKK